MGICHGIMNEMLSFLEIYIPLINQLHFVFHVLNIYWIMFYR